MKISPVKKLLNLLYPQDIKCIICDCELNTGSHYSICEKCFHSLPRNNGKTCLKCGEPIKSMAKYCLHCKKSTPNFTKSFAPLIYKPPITNLIKDFKYNNKKYLAKTLGSFLVESYIINNLNCDIILPVPLYLLREKQRGYNQAYLLAMEFNKQLNLPVNKDILVRTKNTLTQTFLSKQERMKNVKNAFKVTNAQLVKNKVVLLIDDVYTTGSTLNECSECLLLAGAKKVYCLTLAHTLPEKAV